MEGDKLDKNVLSQYANIKTEIKDTRRRIRDIETKLWSMESINEVVKGGEGGEQRFDVEGNPHYRKRKTNLLARRMRLNILEDKLEDTKNEIENFIYSIEDSYIRRLMTYRYIDDLTWDEVAAKMGYGQSADAIRIAHQRFLKKEGIF